jgi:hypothetical protein
VKRRELDPGQRWGTFLSLGNVQDTPTKNHFDWQALDLLGVKYVLLPSRHAAYEADLRAQGLRLVQDTPFFKVFANPGVLPRAFTIDVADRMAREVELPEKLRDQITPAEIIKYRNAKVTIDGEAVAPRLLVLTNNWHPNWTAIVNGTPTPIVKVDGTFRGVWVPAGKFQVEMLYSPKSLPLALALSVVASLSLICLAVFGYDCRRDKPQTL